MQGPTDDVVAAWVRLVRAQRAVMGAVEADLKRAGEPPLSWYDVLWSLVQAPDGRLAPRDLEGALLLEQYNLSRLLDRLEADGLVARVPHPGDRRRQFVEITERGRALRERMWPVYAEAVQRHVGARLGDGEARCLAAILGGLLGGRF
ncbi:MarR family winged helix-turn-helix transcriptional regulator [Salinarimonas soli]|uniref:MarR family transcriptional regulator n=1 Tax=Salinarimonas soli TaxID=1638099 RepID=A0A5B2VAK9_9HYPH|nr:MarR family transcriptional regulator [Salinarimonas soli]KAA2236024.1 MarR family transcriptional regulator [Salinarimonas soli]